MRKGNLFEEFAKQSTLGFNPELLVPRFFITYLCLYRRLKKESAICIRHSLIETKSTFISQSRWNINVVKILAPKVQIHPSLGGKGKLSLSIAKNLHQSCRFICNRVFKRSKFHSWNFKLGWLFVKKVWSLKVQSPKMSHKIWKSYAYKESHEVPGANLADKVPWNAAENFNS